MVSSIRDVKIIRTRRRKNTASARMVKDVLCVRVPWHIPDSQLKGLVDDFKKRIENKLLYKQINSSQELRQRAALLNEKYFSGRLDIRIIEYVTNQNSKFGCCDYARKYIRIAHHVHSMPQWVQDYVIIHELAHLLVPDHSQAFWDLVTKYPLTERARGFLIAKGYDINDEKV